jgi:VanZ family protein
MTKSLALGRLLWRPATILALSSIFFAVIISPEMILAGRLDHGMRLGSSEGIIAILWIETIALMATVGGFLGTTARDVSQPLFAFAVPSLRSTVFRQKLAVGVAAALLLGGGVFFLGDRRGSIAAFGCALFFFALGSSLADPLAGGQWKSMGMGVLLVAWFEAERLIRIFESAPFLWAASCVVVAAAILYREQSIDAARRRAVLQPAPVGFALGGVFKSAYSHNEDFGSVASAAAPASGRVIEFFKAADYEVFGTRPYGWLKTLLTTLLFMCGFGYLTANPAMVGMLGLMTVSTRPHRLMGRWPYPISRANRSNLAFFSSLADCLSYFALAMIAMVLLERSGLPRLTFFGNEAAPAKDLALIPASFIWSPIAIWIGVTGAPRTQKELKSRLWSIRRVIHFFVPVLLAVFTLIAMTRLEKHVATAFVVAAAIALAVIVQGAFWFALRWHFSTKDLV